MKALNQTPLKLSMKERGGDSDNSVEITCQILTISNAILRAGWVTVIHLLMCIQHCK